MVLPRSLRRFVLVVLLLASCGDSSDESADTTVVTTTTGATTTTTTEAATTTTLEATTTEAATTTVVESAVAFPGPGEPWDMVVIGNPRDFGEEFLEMYADSASEVLGVDVNATYAGESVETAWAILRLLRGDAYPDIGGIVREAEIVVMLAAPERSSNDGGPTHIDVDNDNCTYEMSNEKPPAPTTPEYWQPYTDLLDAIYTEIWSLREGTPTVLIGPDLHSRFLKRQREAGIDAECLAWYEAWSAVVRETAEENGAVYVPLWDVLGGPNHDIDAFEAGYTGPSDEYPTIWWGTPNEVGTPMVVDAVVAAGFEPTTQP